MDDATIKGTKVILETRDEQKRVGQEWFRSKLDSKGWFTLNNPISGRYLTAINSNSTAITGKVNNSYLFGIQSGITTTLKIFFFLQALISVL